MKRLYFLAVLSAAVLAAPATAQDIIGRVVNLEKNVAELKEGISDLKSGMAEIKALLKAKAVQADKSLSKDCKACKQTVCFQGVCQTYKCEKGQCNIAADSPKATDWTWYVFKDGQSYKVVGGTEQEAVDQVYGKGVRRAVRYADEGAALRASQPAQPIPEPTGFGIPVGVPGRQAYMQASQGLPPSTYWPQHQAAPQNCGPTG